MSIIEIKRGIPVPAHHAHNRKYPFSDMEIGDSFFVSENWRNVRNAANVFRYRHARDWKFVIRPEGDGYRCWRSA